MCGRYFTGLVSGSFVNVLVNKSIQYVLAIQIGLFGDNFVTNKWLKSYTMCYLIPWLDQGYISYWTSNLSRQYVSAALLSWFQAH